MKIGIDLDGVVFNTEMLWFTFAELYDCIELNQNSIVNKDEARIQEKYNWSDEEIKVFFDKYAAIKDFDIMPGAREVINLLKKDGHELIVITARGSVPSQNECFDIAMQKLRDEGIEFDKYYGKQNNKLETCKSENIDVMIDDNYNTCKILAEENIPTIYFHSLNRRHFDEKKGVREVSNWGEVYRIIKSLEK